MAFTLRIKFRCMCFFAADDRDPAKPTMYVLMPNTNGHHHHEDGTYGGDHRHHSDPSAHEAIEPHAVMLLFPQAGGDLLGNTAHFVDISGCEVVFPGNAEGVDLTFADDLVDLSSITERRVRVALLGENPDQAVVCRMALPAGGIVDDESGAVWNLDGQVGPITQEIIWTIPNVPGDRLRLPDLVRKLRDDAVLKFDPETLPEIEPADDGIIRLEVHHVLASDFPNPDLRRKPDLSGAHFLAYYDLFDNPVRTPKPAFVGRAETPTIACMNGGGHTTKP